MKKYIKNITKLSLLAIFAVSINADYKLGKDYRLVDKPMPVKNCLLYTSDAADE